MLVPQQAGQLGAGRGLARPLEAGEQHHGGSLLGHRKPGVLGAHELHELLMDRVDELVRGVHAGQAVGPQGALPHAVGEPAGDLEVHIGLQQGLAHLLEALGDILLGQLLATAQEGEGAREAFGEGLEHGRWTGQLSPWGGGAPPGSANEERLRTGRAEGPAAAARGPAERPAEASPPPLRVTRPLRPSSRRRQWPRAAAPWPRSRARGGTCGAPRYARRPPAPPSPGPPRHGGPRPSQGHR